MQQQDACHSNLFIIYLHFSICSSSMQEASCGSMIPVIIIYLLFICYYLFVINLLFIFIIYLVPAA
jgi:hypothetical protein